MNKLILFLMLLFGIVTTASSTEDNWHYYESQSLMDDSTTVMLSTESDSIVNAFPDIKVKPTLAVRYKEGNLEAFVDLGIQPKSSNGKTCIIKVRFDSNKAYEIRARLSPDKKALFIVNPKPFIRELSKSSQLLIQFTSYNSADAIIRFNIQGFSHSSQKLFSEAKINLNDKNAAFEDYYYSELQDDLLTSTLINLEVNKNKIKIKTHGNDWQQYARDSSVKELIESSLDFINIVASKVNQNYKLKVNIYGSSSMKKKQTDGGRPFKLSELKEIFQKALYNKAEIKKRVSFEKLNSLPPKYYGKDAPKILSGTIEEYNDMIEIVVDL